MRRLLLLVSCLCALSAGAGAIEIQRVVSPGGIVAWLVRESTLPLLALEFRFRGGAASEPADRPGVGTLAVELLREGAGDLDASAFARALDERSISLGFSIGADSIGGGLRVLSEHRDAGVALLRLALVAPRFDAAAVERVRAQLLSGYARESEEPRAQARRAFQEAEFLGQPYARTLAAVVEGTRAAAVDEMRAFLAGRLARDNLTIGAVGDIAPDEFGRLVDQVFGALPPGAAPIAVPEVRAAIDGERRIVIRRRLPQSIQVFGTQGLKRDDPDWFAGQVVNYVLGGGGFASRLMQEVRVKRGLTYGVGTGMSALDHAALLVGSSSTENARAAQALELIRAEWRRMAEDGPSDVEIEDAKSYLTGSFALALDSSAAVARLLVAIQYDDLGIDYLARRDALIRSVTSEDARRVARRLLGGPGFLTVVVGDPEGVDSGGN